MAGAVVETTSGSGRRGGTGGVRLSSFGSHCVCLGEMIAIEETIGSRR